MPTREDRIFLQLAVKNRWLGEDAARRLAARLDERERAGRAVTAGTLALQDRVLRAEQVAALDAAVRKTAAPPSGGGVRESEVQRTSRRLRIPPSAAPTVSRSGLAARRVPPRLPLRRPFREAALPAGGAGRSEVRSPKSEVPGPESGDPGPESPVRDAGGTGPAAPAADPAASDPIPGYRIVGKLGVGGMASVFRAEAAAAGRPVALKILLPSQARNALSRERFVRESQLLTRFRHPNIVEGIEAGERNGLYYLAMELIDGPSAQEALDGGGRFAEDLALEVILNVARALDYMEKQGFVHRDVKPGNIMITRDGTVKLCDLGFAQPIGSGAGGASDVTCGTPEYMSPEQARGQRDLDIRSDIYALGATLYHLVLGDVPFKGTDTLDVMAKQVLAELYSPGVKERLSRHMHYFIEKMMAKEKDIRYQSSGEVIEDIEAQIEGFRSLTYRSGPPPPAAERLRALVAPLTGGEPEPVPIPVPRPASAALPRVRPPGNPSTRRLRRL